MKRIILLLVYLFSISLNTHSVSTRIDFSIKGLENKSLLFGYEYGNKQIFIDTIKLDKDGKGFFESKKRMTGGIYLIVFPDKKYLQLLINEEQFFTVSTDTSDLLKSLVIEGSDESQMFIEYLLLKKHSDNSNDSSALKATFNFSSKIVKEFPKTFLYQYIKLTENPAKQKLIRPEKSKPDKDFFIKRYYNTKQHYFDNIHFEDIRILRTRLIFEQLDYFINAFTAQKYDSLISSIRQVTELSKVNEESYHFVLEFLFNNYKSCRNQLHERVFVFIADNYYLGNKAPWADKKFLTLLEKRVNDLRKLTEGSIAPALDLQTLNCKKINSGEIKSEYLILFFWSPDCNSCMNQIFNLYDLYKKFRNKQLQILAIYTHADKLIWESYIKEKGYNEWINAYDPTFSSNFAKLYDVQTLPKLFLLDSNKKILLKDVDVDKLEEFFYKTTK